MATRLPNCEIRGFCRQHLATLTIPTIRSTKCKQSPVYFHIPLPIVTKHELGLPFPSRNLPVKFGTNPSTIFLVIVVTDTQTHTDTQTNAGKNILARFRGENNTTNKRDGQIFWDTVYVRMHVCGAGSEWLEARVSIPVVLSVMAMIQPHSRVSSRLLNGRTRTATFTDDMAMTSRTSRDSTCRSGPTANQRRSINDLTASPRPLAAAGRLKMREWKYQE